MQQAAIQSPQIARLAVLGGHMGKTLPADLIDRPEHTIEWAAEFAGPAWGDLGRGYIEVAERAGYVRANRQLHEYSDLIRDDLYLAAEDGDIRAFCDRRVKECQGLLAGALANSTNNPFPLADPESTGLLACSAVLDRYGMAWPAPYSLLPGPGMDLQPLAAKLCCKRWWRRNVRRLQAMVVGQLARKRKKVAKYRQCYVDDWNVKRHQEAARRNAETLSHTVAVNQDGQEYTLQELADLGPGNLNNRRNELMVRIRGFEEVARDRGHVGEFWTFTKASQWHRMRWLKKPGKAVPVRDWNESTPKEAQDHLCQVWSRIRASLARQGIRVYGFRVVEPHHDGCPHWHLLVFMRPDDVKAARKTCRRYLLADNGAEPGAWRRRFDAKRMDPAKGTASGYIAKYIAKNIDGAGVRGALGLADDDSGLAMSQGAARVRAWASTWGIPQFQQIGGPSVTVWRELRRLSADCEASAETDFFGNYAVEGAALAADEGDWASFVECMGGPDLPRAERPVRPAYWVTGTDVDRETGELVAGLTCYGEPAAGQVFGLYVWGKSGCDRLSADEHAVLTRPYRWDIEHRPEPTTYRVEERGPDWILGRNSAPEWAQHLGEYLQGAAQQIKRVCPFSCAAGALDLCQ